MAMNDGYSTSDTALAAYLTVRGFPLKGAFRRDQRIWFEFDASGDEVERSVAEFFSANGSDLVSAQIYANAEQRLRRLIRDVDRR